MPVIRISRYRGMLFSGLMAAVWLTACLPDPGLPPVQTGAGGTTPTGAVGSAGTGPGSSAGATGIAGSASASAGTVGSATAGRGGNPGAGGSPVTGAAGAATAGRGGSGSGSTGAGGTASGGRGGGSAGRGGSGALGGRGGSGASTGGGAAGTSASTGGSSGNTLAAYTVCTPCHGDDGAGVAGKGPDIQHPVVDYFTWVIRNGRIHPDFPEAMPQFTTALLPDVQLQSILTFLAAPAKPTTGAGLYRDYCANCHGADAAGGVTMRPIAAEPMTAFTTNVRNGHSAGMFSNRREFMPRWTAAQISDAEIQLIFTYVGSL